MKYSPSKEQLSKWHNDPQNWKWGVFYCNAEDPRIWLPKRVPIMGWTLNFAHKKAYLWMLILLLLPLLILFFLPD
jgi:uncharacterized membrane protein